MTFLPGKIKLERKEMPKSGIVSKSLVSCLPFFKSRRGAYVHRVRRAASHWSKSGLHVSVDLWCGQNGFIGKKGSLYRTVPEGCVLCATCEGRAIGAGLVDSGEINGRAVKYSPTK